MRPGALKKAVLFLVLALGLPALGQALTLSEIRTDIRRNVRDTDATSRRFSDTLLNTLINEVQRDVNNQTWVVEASTSYVLTAGTTFYSLPSDFIAAKRAIFTLNSGSKIQLREDSEKGVVDGSPDFERSSAGAPIRYFVRQSKSGGTALQISYLPVPTSASTGTIRVDYVVQPTDLSSDSDVPFEGQLHLLPYHQALSYGVTMRIKLWKGEVEEAQAYAQLYDRMIQAMVGGTGRMPNFRPSFSGASR